MRRFPLKFRLSTYQEGLFYTLIPVGRRQVAPGERVSKLVLDMRFTSAVFDKANLTPVLAQAWAFYVPFRIVWPSWVDFIALDDTVTSTPTTTTEFKNIFEHGSGAKSSLARRSYKLIYNQYFGDEAASGAGETCWYANPDDDTVATLGRLLVWDQYRSHLRSGAYTSQNYVAAVSGASATIVLDDLSRALRDNNARRRQKITGDKYVDTMRLMGVELDWRVQMAPEFLGSSQQVIFGSAQQSAGTDLSLRATNWEGQMQLLVKRRLAFAEHGIIWVLAGFRPLISAKSTSITDATFQTQAHYFRPDTAGGPVNTGAQMIERNSVYLKGRNCTGVADNNNAFFDSGAVSTMYPDPQMFVPSTGSGPNHLAMISDISIAGLTPIPASRG